MDFGLYKIKQEIISCIDPETGEIDSERFDALEMEREQKLEQLGQMYLEYVADAEKIKSEIARLEERKTKITKLADSIKATLENDLHGECFETPLLSINYRKSSQLIVDDLSVIPAEYLKYSEPKPNKEDIKRALKRGENIGGVHIEEKLNMSIK